MDTQLLPTMSKKDFLALAEQKYYDLQQLKEKLTLYDYEKSFDEIWQELGRQVLEKNLSNVPDDRRKKKDENSLRSDRNS